MPPERYMSEPYLTLGSTPPATSPSYDVSAITSTADTSFAIRNPLPIRSGPNALLRRHRTRLSRQSRVLTLSRYGLSFFQIPLSQKYRGNLRHLLRERYLSSTNDFRFYGRATAATPSVRCHRQANDSVMANALLRLVMMYPQ